MPMLISSWQNWKCPFSKPYSLAAFFYWRKIFCFWNKKIFPPLNENLFFWKKIFSFFLGNCFSGGHFFLRIVFRKHKFLFFKGGGRDFFFLQNTPSPKKVKKKWPQKKQNFPKKQGKNIFPKQINSRLVAKKKIVLFNAR